MHHINKWPVIMHISPKIIPVLISAITEIIEQNAEEVTLLDQTLGDGDHVTNLQRGLQALANEENEIAQLEWPEAIQKIGMTLLSTMGGASGSLFGTFFISMSKAAKAQNDLDQNTFSSIFSESVDAVKKRGKSDAGEKTMLDVLIPVANTMKQGNDDELAFSTYLQSIMQSAIAGMESTKNMIATKGRASYMQEKSIGHIDAGAKTCQLIICTIVNKLEEESLAG